MFCTQCGNKLKEDAAFCTNCGAPRKAKPAAEEPKVVKTEEPKIVKTEAPKIAETETPKMFSGFSVAGSLSDEEPEVRRVPAKAPEAAKVQPVEAPAPKVIYSAPAPKAAEPAPRPVESTPRPAAPAPRAAEPAPRPAAPAPRPTAPRPAVPADPVATDWNNSFFDGGLLGLIGVNLVVSLVSLITFGLAWPALTCFRLRWIYKHTCIGGYRLRFTGKGIQLFGKFWLWVLLSIVTLTIYTWWVPIKYKQWETKHVVIDSMIPQARR